MTYERMPHHKQKAGDALLKSFLRYRSYLGRVVRRIVGPHDAEDIVQQTFLRSYEAQARKKIEHPRAFMVRTATNLALNLAMKADNRLTDRIACFDDSAVPLVTESLEEKVASQERLVLFCRAVQRLPPQCQRAYLLKKVYGLSRKEIAAQMKISESTVQKHIAKGTLMCAEYMDLRVDPALRGKEGTSRR